MEKSFRAYIQALASAEKKPASPTTEDERKLYGDALKIYLDGAHAPRETAQHLLQLYSDTIRMQPDFLELRLVVTTAYANLGNFDEFFPLFYPAYCAYPDHYLSHKTQAVLHIKLFERCRNVSEREAERTAVLFHVKEAIQKYPEDIGLYKLWLLFAEEQNKDREVEACLNKILNSPMIIARSDLPFFAQQALDARRSDLAERLMEKGRVWYPYSRGLDSIQQALDDYKRRQAP
ncbi:MAG: hypothetical protein LLG04_00625 [Parachlamydia sp.]|nr:hypothetical protein [Parachlamydia sp.]